MADASRPGGTQVALVTGSSRGIGRGIAIELARAGMSVAVNYQGNRAAAEETCALCRAAGTAGDAARFEAFQADIGSKADRARLVEEVFARFGRLDALVNNAGMAPRARADLSEASEESFEELMRVNLQGPYFLTQAVARRWLADPIVGPAAAGARPGRAIVFITSISAETASIMRGEYCVSKAGLAMAVKLWATRLAGTGAQVFEVRPGIMETDMTAKVKSKYDELIGQGLVPEGRWGTPADVGRAVRALVSGDFVFSTGSVIHCDGGFAVSRL